jgi:hypothetical protein
LVLSILLLSLVFLVDNLSVIKGNLFSMNRLSQLLWEEISEVNQAMWQCWGCWNNQLDQSTDTDSTIYSRRSIKEYYRDRYVENNWSKSGQIYEKYTSRAGINQFFRWKNPDKGGKTHADLHNPSQNCDQLSHIIQLSFILSKLWRKTCWLNRRVYQKKWCTKNQSEPIVGHGFWFRSHACIRWAPSPRSKLIVEFIFHIDALQIRSFLQVNVFITNRTNT